MGGLIDALARLLTDDDLALRLADNAAATGQDWRSTPEEYADRVRGVVETALRPQPPMPQMLANV